MLRIWIRHLSSLILLLILLVIWRISLMKSLVLISSRLAKWMRLLHKLFLILWKKQSVVSFRLWRRSWDKLKHLCKLRLMRAVILKIWKDCLNKKSLILDPNLKISLRNLKMKLKLMYKKAISLQLLARKIIMNLKLIKCSQAVLVCKKHLRMARRKSKESCLLSNNPANLKVLVRD